MAKRKGSATDNWLDQAVEVPRKGAKSSVDREKRQKFYRRFIVAAVILLPISLAANVIVVGNAARGPAEVVEAVELGPEGKAVAIVAVEQWLSADLSPVPGRGSLISWDSAEQMVKPVLSSQRAQQAPLPEFEVEIHSFTVRDSLGSLYGVEVQVGVSTKTGAKVLGAPSLMPQASTDDSAFSSFNGWAGLSSATAPDAVTGAVTAWASAFTSGKPDTLRIAVQDEDGTNTYVALSNVATHEVEVTRAAYLPDEDQDPTKAIVKGSQMVVQVELSVRWNGSPAPGSGQKLPTITYDLLVDKVGGGAPVVIAWGGAGTGPDLTKYGNALDGRKVAPIGTIKDDPATSETETSSTTEPATPTDIIDPTDSGE